MMKTLRTYQKLKVKSLNEYTICYSIIDFDRFQWIEEGIKDFSLFGWNLNKNGPCPKKNIRLKNIIFAVQYNPEIL
jgi:hypothetical protein